MRGMKAVLAGEILTQLRSGLTALYLGMPLIWIIIIRLLPTGFRPVVTLLGVYADPVLMGSIFTGAFLARERDQGLFAAWAVTPMDAGLWLIARVLVIALQGSIAGIILVLGAGVQADIALLIPSLFLASACGALNGLLLARPFRDILSFILAGGSALALINIPLVGGYLRPGRFWFFTGPAWSGWSALGSALGLSVGGGNDGVPRVSAAAALGILTGWVFVLFLLVRHIYKRGFFRRPGGGGE